MKKILIFLFGLLFALGVRPAALGTEKEFPNLMRAFDWIDLSENDRDIYIAGVLESFSFGVLESFSFRLYSTVDEENPNQLTSYSELISCLQTERKAIAQILSTSFTFGEGLKASTPGIIWDTAVPIACKGKQEVPRFRAPLRFISHFDWINFTKDQKKLFLKGFLGAQLNLLSREPDSDRKTQDIASYKKIVNETGLNKTIDLVDAHGLEPGVPIPWSIARANGNQVGRGPGFSAVPTVEDWSSKTANDMVETWAVWIDLEAVSTVCAVSWRKMGPLGFKSTIHNEIVRQHKCVAQQITGSLIPAFFSGLNTPKREMEKMRAMLSPTMIQEKTSMAKNYFSNLSPEGKIRLCEDQWGQISHPGKSIHFSVHQIQYNLSRLPRQAETKQLASSVLSSCKVPRP
jgi:hypothetical protein